MSVWSSISFLSFYDMCRLTQISVAVQNSTLTNKDARQKMSPSNARSLNYMKQKLKKNNKLYEEDIAKFKENPESEEEKEEVGAVSLKVAHNGPSSLHHQSLCNQPLCLKGLEHVSNFAAYAWV